MTASVAAVVQHFLAAVFLACAAGQVLHGYLRIMHATPGRRAVVAAYEAALLAHIVVMAACSVAPLGPVAGAAASASDAAGQAAPFAVQEEPALLIGNPQALLWANAAVAAAIVGAAFAGLQSAGESRRVTWMLPIEAVLAFACMPPVLMLVGDWRCAVVAADALYLAFRIVFLLVLDRSNRYRIVSSLAVTEAVKRLPEGIMYADEQGALIDANTAMRRILSALGLSPDSATVHDLHRELAERSRNGQQPAAPAAWPADEPEAWTIVRIGDDEVRLFAFDGLGYEAHSRYPVARPLGAPQQAAATSLFGATPHTRVIAYDVTEEMRLIDDIQRTNEQLQASQRELRASAEAMRAAAENEAMLKMRGRVHDVIGQRLSLLHRALEDNALTDEKLEQMKPLLNGILDDLSADVRVSPADDLAATVDAFALSGVEVRVEGRLPSDEDRARLFAACVREAATNAVKHARARQVRVVMSEGELAVSNDGAPPAGPITEGTGLTHMRHAAESAGATMEITPDPFTIHVRA